MLDLKRQNAALAADLRAAFERVLGSGQFILGPEVEALEVALAGYLSVAQAIAVSSGTDAILLALMTLGVGPGDEVICPSFTFFATAGCVARAGATPVFADSCPECFNIDAADARRRVTPRTKAIIPVHLFGQAAHMDEVMNLAREHGLAVIEDAAQALGAEWRGGKAGTFGTFGAFSFYPSKNLGGFGDAGLLVTNDGALAAKARLLRTHGAETRYFHKMIGGNFRMDPLQAALLRVKLPHLDSYCSRRAENAAYYSAKLDGRVIPPRAHPDRRHIWNQYTLRVPLGARDALRDHLLGRGIGCELYYPLPLHAQECFRHEGVQPLPVAEQLARECLSIPVYPELSRWQQDAVIAAIGSFRAT